jgi:polysaccharide biosynthesis transport protein
MNKNDQGNDIPIPDLSKSFNVIKKRKYSFLGIIFLFFLAGLAYVNTVKPVYRAKSVILIGTQTSDRFQGQKDQGFEEVDPTNSEFYKTQYALLKSTSLIKAVIQDLNLVENSEFKSDPPLIDLSIVRGWVSSVIKYLDIPKLLGRPEREVKTEEIKIDPDARLVGTFLKRLSISPVSKSHVVGIGFEGYDPVTIAYINNSFLDALIQRNIKRRSKVLDGSEKWMSEKLLDLKVKMADSEQKLAGFRKQNDIIDFKKNREISAYNLSKYQDEIRKVESTKLRLSDLKHLLFQLKKNPVDLIHNLPDDLKTRTVNSLIKSYADLTKEYGNLSKEYSSLHPKVQIVYQKLKSVEAQVPVEIDRLIASIDLDFRGTNLHEQSLKNAMELEKAKIMKMDNQEFSFNALKDEYDSSKILHTDLLKRFKEIDIASYSNESSIKIVDNAEIPYIPVRPKKGFILVLCLMSGIIVALIWVVFLETMNKTVITVQDVVRQIPFPFLGATGIVGKNELPLPVINHSNAFIAEEFRTVKTNLMLNGFVGDSKVLMIGSSTPKEGKTTVATNLAATFAMEGKRVLIIEADFVRPKIAEVMQTVNKPGLLDILESPRLFKSILENHSQDSKKLDKIFVKSSVDGVYVLPRGNLKMDYPDMINFGILGKLLDLTKKIFDVIIIDTPPALAFSYVSITAQLSDGVLFVIGSGMKDKKLITRSINKLHAATSDGSFKPSTNGANGQHLDGHFPGGNGSNGKSDPTPAPHHSKIFGVVLNKVKYHRDEYYEYHRKYFTEYYSTMNKKSKKDILAEKA